MDLCGEGGGGVKLLADSLPRRGDVVAPRQNLPKCVFVCVSNRVTQSCEPRSVSLFRPFVAPISKPLWDRTRLSGNLAASGLGGGEPRLRYC